MYYREQQDLAKSTRLPNGNEKWLIHGTGITNPDDICKRTGFDFRSGTTCTGLGLGPWWAHYSW
jgi:hypothetical protein